MNVLIKFNKTRIIMVKREFFWILIFYLCMMKHDGASSAMKVAQTAPWPTSITPSTSATTESAESLTFDFQSGLTETMNTYRLNIDSSSRIVKDSYVPFRAMDSSFTSASHSFVPSKVSTVTNIRTHSNSFVSDPSNTTFRSGFTSRASITAQTIYTRTVAMSRASASSKTQEVISDSISLLSYIAPEVLYSSEFIQDCTLQGLCTFSAMSSTAYTPITFSDVTSSVSSAVASLKSVSGKNYFGFFTSRVSSSPFHLENSKQSRNSLRPSLTVSFTTHDSSATFDGSVSVVAGSETQSSASDVSSPTKISRTIDTNSELASSPKTIRTDFTLTANFVTTTVTSWDDSVIFSSTQLSSVPYTKLSRTIDANSELASSPKITRTDFTDLTAESVTTTVTSWDDSVIFSSTQLSSTPYLHSQTSSVKSTYIRPTPSLTTSKPSQTVTTEDPGENLARCNTGQQQVDNIFGIPYKELTFIFAGTAATLLCILIPFACCCCRYRRQLQEVYEDEIARLGKEEDLSKIKRTDLQHMLKYFMKAARYERKIKKQQKQERSTDNTQAASGDKLSDVKRICKRHNTRRRISDVFTEIKDPRQTERPIMHSNRSSVAKMGTFEPLSENYYLNHDERFFDTKETSEMHIKIRNKRNTKKDIRKFHSDGREDASQNNSINSHFLSVRSGHSYRSLRVHSKVNIPDAEFCDEPGPVFSTFGNVLGGSQV